MNSLAEIIYLIIKAEMKRNMVKKITIKRAKN